MSECQRRPAVVSVWIVLSILLPCRPQVTWLVHAAAAAQPPASTADWSSSSSAAAGADAVPSGTIDAGGLKLDMDELRKLGIVSEDVLVRIRQLIEDRYRCNGGSADTAVVGGASTGVVGLDAGTRSRLNNNGVQLTTGFDAVGGDLHRQFIRNKTVTCNDGSKAGYYIRKTQTGSARWMIFLEGGWMCFDRKSCDGRWLNTPHLMSSDQWPLTRRGSGILSWDSTENPFIHDGNIVLIPYCSSDSWSGTYKSRIRGEFSYMGALIIDEVVKDLASFHGLSSASTVFLAGSSAGGTGVLLNVDRVSRQVALLAPSAIMRGVVDSGWFLDNRPFRSVQCTDAHQCSPSESVQRGIQLWHGQVPDACRGIYPGSDHWKCYFGYRLYSTLQTVIFVIQHLFDEAQVTADNVGPPIRRDQWQYIHNVGLDMKHTLSNVSAVFAPACLSHMLITISEWRRVEINGVSLPEALQCWESGARNEKNSYERISENHHHQQQRSRGHYVDPAPQLITGDSSGRRRDKFQSDDPLGGGAGEGGAGAESVVGGVNRRKELRRLQRQEARRNAKRKMRERSRRLRHAASGSAATKSVVIGYLNSDGDATGRPAARPRRASSITFDVHDIHHVQQHANRCSHHRIDQCAWPQCNLSCPKVRNPFTGDEMDFVDLLMQFGLDLTGIADALGIDLQTLQNMDHAELLRLLIQNAR